MDRIDIDWHADQDWRKIVGEIRSESESSIQAEVARRTGSSGLPLIAKIAASITGVEVEEMLGSGRHPDVVDARTIYSGVARAITTCSFPEIARGLCRSAHSTSHRQAEQFDAWPARKRKAMIEHARQEIERSKRCPTTK